MRTKTFLILAAATLVVGVVAALALRGRESAVSAKGEHGPFLPGLADELEQARTLVVTDAEGTVTLRRGEDGWTVAEKGGYPAKLEPIRKTLIGLAEMRTLEPKTDDPERWAKLGVGEPGAEGTSSKLVRVEDGAGAKLAELVVGNTRSAGAREQQVYVRRPDEKQAWLVQASLELPDQAKGWLESSILELKRDRVQAIEVVQAGSGEALRVARPSKETTSFEVIGLGEGQELRYPTVADSLGNALEYFNLEDVLPAAEADFSQGTLATARFWTFDGLRVDVTTKEDAGRTLARVEASYDPGGANFVPQGPSASDAKPAADAPASEVAGADASTAEADQPAAAAQRSPDEVRAEAEKLQARLAPWAFVIPAYNRANFTKRLTDLVKEPPQPEEDDALGTDERPVVIPSNLPPEIQEQIRKHQESLGNTTVVRDVEPADGSGAQPAEGNGAQPAGGSGAQPAEDAPDGSEVEPQEQAPPQQQAQEEQPSPAPPRQEADETPAEPDGGR